MKIRTPYGLLTAMAINFKKKRLDAELSQEDTSFALGLSRVSVVNIEAGNQALTIANLLMAAILFKCDISEILPTSEQFVANINIAPSSKDIRKQKRIEKLESELLKLKSTYK